MKINTTLFTCLFISMLYWTPSQVFSVGEVTVIERSDSPQETDCSKIEDWGEDLTYATCKYQELLKQQEEANSANPTPSPTPTPTPIASPTKKTVIKKLTSPSPPPSPSPSPIPSPTPEQKKLIPPIQPQKKNLIFTITDSLKHFFQSIFFFINK